MSASSTPHNRRERRAQAHAQAQSKSIASASKGVPLSLPSRTPPSQKTLLEIAEERQLLNRRGDNDAVVDPPSITTTTINPDGSLSTSSDSPSPDPLHSTPLLDVILYTVTLTVIHFTLTFLVHHQYASEPPSTGPLFLSSSVFSATPFLFLVLVFILHPRASHLAAQALFAAMSIVAGGWLVYATNDEPYMAVMKKAPALGTLWIWAVIEMRWEWAVVCLSLVGGWGWWKGYTFF
ncbi:hypothetical protein MMC07_005949 [Pseudocyphellaria aurata]|nr:hypothetical protein [Pseudocyphellaria aurata]